MWTTWKSDSRYPHTDPKLDVVFDVRAGLIFSIYSRNIFQKMHRISVQKYVSTSARVRDRFEIFFMPCERLYISPTKDVRTVFTLSKRYLSPGRRETTRVFVHIGESPIFRVIPVVSASVRRLAITFSVRFVAPNFSATMTYRRYVSCACRPAATCSPPLSLSLSMHRVRVCRSPVLSGEPPTAPAYRLRGFARAHDSPT